ncbi:MAG: branched-chain amino acid ABC transporter permease, partial [Paracoccaceae bacterium]|nr:branched-chain amino acid ABC transporter permease [Paracoccaceae bacterium]
MEFLNAFVALANFVIVPAISYGSQLALGALGVTLIYGILRFSNFAHGDTMAFGAMVTILFTWWFQSMGISFGPLPTALLAMPFGIIGTGLLLLVTDRTVYRFYRRQKAAPVILVIVSMGVMFVMNGLVRFIIGVDDQRFADGARFIISARDFKEMTGLKEGLAIKASAGITVITAILVVAALFWFLNKTRTGKSMRAFSDNEDLALLSGINPERVVMVTWLIVAALATVAGTLYGLDKSFKPFTYFQLLLPIFAAAIVGGLGNPIGAIAGGFVIAFSEVTITYAFKKVLGYV